MADDVQLLRIPGRHHSVEGALNTALKLELGNVLIISEAEDGDIIFLSAVDLSAAEINWLLDRAKALQVTPSAFHRVGP